MYMKKPNFQRLNLIYHLIYFDDQKKNKKGYWFFKKSRDP